MKTDKIFNLSHEEIVFLKHICKNGKKQANGNIVILAEWYEYSPFKFLTIEKLIDKGFIKYCKYHNDKFTITNNTRYVYLTPSADLIIALLHISERDLLQLKRLNKY